jgi:hypothetical protein
LDDRKRVVLSSFDRIVVTVATTAKKDRATELSLADFLRENCVALAAAKIVVGFPFEKESGVLGIGPDYNTSVIRRFGDYFQFHIRHCDPPSMFFEQFQYS